MTKTQDTPFELIQTEHDATKFISQLFDNVKLELWKGTLEQQMQGPK